MIRTKYIYGETRLAIPVADDDVDEESCAAVVVVVVAPAIP
jgi:hypothetical protein